jgi:hypothetical protein
MTSYLTKPPAGIAGSLIPNKDNVVEAIFLGTPTATAYGIPLKISSGKAIPFAGGETAASLYGVLSREVPCINGTTNDSFAGGAPVATQAVGICVEGYMQVICAQGSPTRGGDVYIRIVAAPGKNIGDWEATADGVNNVLFPKISWATEGRDTANGNIAAIHITK